MTGISYEVGAEGFATICWDMPGRSMNVIDPARLALFSRHLETALADTAVKGIIVTSAKPAFIAGSDLTWLAATLEEKAGETPELQRRRILKEMLDMSMLFRRLEAGGKPVVAAIPGTALGGGFELCLACHRRIVADASRTLLGLPESTLGLLPGAGGTVRYTRMLGVDVALPLLWDGTTMPPAEALRLGLIDEIVSPGALMDAALAWLRAATPDDAVKPWDRKRFSPPGSDFRTGPGSFKWAALNAGMRSRSKGNYPALQAIQRAVYDGWLVPTDLAIEIEVKCFVGLLLDPVARNMIRTKFINWQRLRKSGGRPGNVPATGISGVEIVGAGHAAEAIRTATAGVKPGEGHVLSVAVDGTEGHGDSKLTAGVLDGPRDGRVHLCFGVGELNGGFVEVSAAPEARPEDVAAAVDLGRAARRTTLVVPCNRGSYLGRLALAYVAEGLRLLNEGVELFRIENAGKSLSLPEGPIMLAARIGPKALEAAFRMRSDGTASGADLAAAAAILKRLIGRSSGGIPVIDQKDAARRLDAEMIQTEFHTRAGQPDSSELKTRLLTVIEVETLRAMEDGMIQTPESGDVAAVFGLGFPAWTGGPFAHVDTVGAKNFLSLADDLANTCGARFDVPAGRRAALLAGQAFYPTLDFAA